MSRRTLALALGLALSVAAPALADDDPPTPCACPDLRAVPPVLDPAYRHRRKLQVEVESYGGSLLGTTVGSTWIAGLRAGLHLGGPWAVQADYGVSRSPDAAIDRTVHVLTGSVMIANDVAMRIGRHLVEMDLYLTLGAGAMRLDATWRPAGRVGGGLKIYTGLSWLAIRVDVDTYLHPVPGSFNGDLSVTAGLSFLFPPRPSPLEGGPCPPR
jgi:hypothetical protein